MRSILKRLIALSLLALVAPYRAGALGLGDIKLNSYLNQPLNAWITVLPAKAEPLDQVRISLAPRSAFEQAGIERLPVLNHIKFQLVKGANGKPQIKLSSNDPIKEPFLDFILQVSWPNGRISREYTVLLDPPTTTAEQAPPVQPAAAASTKAQGSAQVAAASAGGAAPAPAAPHPAVQSGTAQSFAKLTKDAYGRTRRDDTLWSIAKTVRPDDSVSVQQVMLALVKKNPRAFYNGNVNTLKAGYILRLPNKELISQVGEVAALHEVQRQYRQWQQIKQGSLLADNGAAAAKGHGAAPGAAAAAKGAAKPHAKAKANAKPGEAGAGSAGAKTAQGARLTLLPPSADKAGAGGAATVSGTEQGQGAGGTVALKKQLDNLKQTQENQIETLRNQVDQLNQQVTSMQRLLSLKDNTLSTLQQKLGNLQGEAPAAQVVPKPAPAAAPAKPQTQVAKPAATKPAQTAAVTPPAAPAPRKVTPPAHVRHERAWLADPKVLGMGGVVVLLLSALSWISVRRRRMTAEAFAPEEESVTEEAAAEVPATEAAAEPQGEQPYMPTGGDLLEAEINEIDPLAEADVYMAYRRYQQAEDLLRSAIQQEPNRHELQLKLVEVFAASGNSQAFLAEAQNLYNELDGRDNVIWSKVAEMGRDIQPDHPLFMEDNGGSPSHVAGGADKLDSPQAADEPAAAGVADPAPASGEEEDLADLLAMDDDLLETAADIPLQEPSPMEETTAVAPSDGMSETGLDAPPAGEPRAAVPEETADVADNGIEFESGLDVGTAAAADEPAETPAATGQPQGNEIDFEMPADGLSLEDSPVSDAPQAQDGTRVPDTVDIESADTDQPLSATGEDGALEMDAPTVSSVPEEPAASETAETPSHDLDFDIDFDKIAGRGDRDFDNFFEELESADSDQGEDVPDMGSGHEEVGTKLDLAKAFIEMGDQEGAKEILQEVVNLGDADQKQEAQGLLQQLQV